MKVGDLVDFLFEDAYTGLIVAMDDIKVKVLFLDKDTQIDIKKTELDDCDWEVISESR